MGLWETSAWHRNQTHNPTVPTAGPECEKTPSVMTKKHVAVFKTTARGNSNTWSLSLKTFNNMNK